MMKKHYLKRILSFALTLGIVVSGFTAWNSETEVQASNAKTELVSKNIAIGKPVTGIKPNQDTRAAAVTDGSTACDNSQSYYEIGQNIDQNPAEPYYIQIDLGEVYPVEKINMWRYYIGEPRSYHNTIVFVSEDEEFKADDIVYNSDKEDFFGLGAGTDEEYEETDEGKEICFEARSARYIRVINNGHTLYSKQGGHYVEIQAWAEVEEEVPAMRNADETLDIPSFEATGKEEGVTHPDVVRFDQAWNGYLYWMAVTPNQNGSSQFENPCLAASNDGMNWVVPDGITNPLTGVPEEPLPYHNCDNDLVYNEAENALYMYYIWSKDSPAAGQSGWQPSEVRLIKITHDTDGFQITGPITVVTSTYRYDLLSPAIVAGADGIWRMWSVNTGDQGWNNQTNYVELRTSKDGVNWSEPKSLKDSFIQKGYQPWHVDVSYIPEKGEYWAFFPAYPDGGGSNYTEQFYAKSSDGEIWTTYEKSVLKPKPGAWDSDFIYRSTFLYDNKTDNISLWYSAGKSQGWKIAYTENTYTDMVGRLGHSMTPEKPVDATSLELAIAMAEKMAEEQAEKGSYTKESWAVVGEALKSAKALLETDVTQEQADEAFLSLITACNMLENGTQKVGLEAAIKGTEAILADTQNLANYTAESIEAVETALAEAILVFENPAADQGTINAATTNLLTAVTCLLAEPDNTRLDILIQTTEKLLENEEQYTPSSVQDLRDALKRAKEVRDNTQASDQEISDAYNRLAESVTGIIRKANKEELKNALDQAVKILNNSEKYVASTISGLADVKAEAQTVYDNAEADANTTGEALKKLIAEILKARLLGDVDLNGSVDTQDAAELLKCKAELKELTKEQEEAGDVNQNGETDSSDAAVILQLAAEKINKF